MNPLDEQQIRASLVNATRSERQRMILPELAEVRWDRLDYLGWRDRKQPLAAYAVTEVDGEPVGIILRAPETSSRRAAMCAWCEDVADGNDTSLYVARRAGAPGRKGNTIGTLICTDFRCSRNVRRRPTLAEAGFDDDVARAAVVERRIDGLRERTRRFLEEVRSTA
ncbi:treble-clef zinc-finger protein [Isoptericola sp. CG 20/1183]|uniref:Treble-clef zinc-finger protein n=1 Tax=Isoptericola halotolerans TaxID=300560 RepID=A0ABX5EGV1_9MICO|nr:MULTISPECIES: FBP domain-containing protein [Isoptericola]MCK0116103.1 FBP domain-containing protein [Isoptericola sp. S6320L]PRZ08719.1 treble-clef zinc-finger protein [Isoptericola halotolerans]PRZ10834.1 treble-clef zinc-finger protein [Isoptericola sp. CG 20/1183]